MTTAVCARSLWTYSGTVIIGSALPWTALLCGASWTALIQWTPLSLTQKCLVKLSLRWRFTQKIEGFPLVVISGSPDDMQFALDNGLQLLEKPFKGQELIDALTKGARQRRIWTAKQRLGRCRMKRGHKSGNQTPARCYRAQAAQLRQEAAAATDDLSRQQLLELASKYDRRADAAERESRR